MLSKGGSLSMGGSAPSAPSPVSSAQGGLESQIATFPFSSLINELAETGSTGTAINPTTGQPETYDFSGLGTANVQNTVSNQMAQTLLGIQQNYGPQYIQLALQNLQQSDPQGYAAYSQLFNQIQQEAQANPDQPLSNNTQSAINNLLQNAQTLSPTAETQVLQGSNAGNVATGITSGNIPEQNNVNAVVNAADQQQNQVENAAAQYLGEGVSPADISYRTLEQNLQNLGSFVAGQNPETEFQSISGASGGAAPYPQTNVQNPSINENAAASAGLNLANNLFGTQSTLAENTANPYLAGLNFGLQGISTGLNVNPNLFNEFGSTYSTPFTAEDAAATGAGTIFAGGQPLGNASGTASLGVNEINNLNDFSLSGY